MYKIIDTYNEKILYITDNYQKAVEWSDFYHHEIGLNVRIDTYNEH